MKQLPYKQFCLLAFLLIFVTVSGYAQPITINQSVRKCIAPPDCGQILRVKVAQAVSISYPRYNSLNQGQGLQLYWSSTTTGPWTGPVNQVAIPNPCLDCAPLPAGFNYNIYFRRPDGGPIYVKLQDPTTGNWSNVSSVVTPSCP